MKPLYVEFGGERRSLSEWARLLGVTLSTVRWRMQRWPVERALTLPARDQVRGVHHCSYCGDKAHNTRTCQRYDESRGA